MYPRGYISFTLGCGGGSINSAKRSKTLPTGVFATSRPRGWGLFCTRSLRIQKITQTSSNTLPRLLECSPTHRPHWGSRPGWAADPARRAADPALQPNAKCNGAMFDRMSCKNFARVILCTFVPRGTFCTTCISSAPFFWGVVASFGRVYTSSSAPQCERNQGPSDR